MTNKPRILVTNDDGIYAEGILALKAALEAVGEVFVVAPDRPRSACGHSITLHKPLRMNKVRLPDGSHGYAVSGTPSDSVSLAVIEVMRHKVDLVVSGINPGPNLGWDLTYSGTVSAAMEAVMMGFPAIAASVASHAEDMSYDLAARFTAHIARIVLTHGLPADTLLNINVPHVPADRLNGIEVTRQGRRRYAGQIQKRLDPNGREYYWLGGDVPVDEMEEGTDVKAIADQKISVTPVHLDLTGYSSLDEVRSWGVDEFEY
jgi:5'-nucleotidase